MPKEYPFVSNVYQVSQKRMGRGGVATVIDEPEWGCYWQEKMQAEIATPTVHRPQPGLKTPNLIYI